MGEGYLGKSRGKHGERTFWASPEIPCSRKKSCSLGSLFTSTHNCKTPSCFSFSSSAATTSALLLFKNRFLECRNLFQAHPSRHLHHLSQPILQHLTHSLCLPSCSGHMPSFLGGKLPCSSLPGILALTNSCTRLNPPSRRHFSVRSEKAGENRSAKTRALGTVCNASRER